MYCDKGKDDEILSKLHNSSNTQPDWHGPNSIGMGQNKRSFKASARIPFTTSHSNLSSGLTRWVHSHAVKVPLTSTTKVSFSDNADAKTNNAKVSSSDDADAKINNALSFRHTASSTLQLVVASDNDKLSKGSTKINNASSFRHTASYTLQLVVVSIDDKLSKGSTKSNNALPFGGKPHKGLFDSKSLSNNDFRLIVDSKLILYSEGEHTTKPNGLVDRNDLVYFDNHISLIGPINLLRSSSVSATPKTLLAPPN
jgi:hypothetical protein